MSAKCILSSVFYSQIHPFLLPDLHFLILQIYNPIDIADLLLVLLYHPKRYRTCRLNVTKKLK